MLLNYNILRGDTVREPIRRDRIFRALADPTRRRILDLLRERGLTTGQICDELADLDRCTVMQHIGVLARADLVISKREGRHRWNYLNCVPIQQIYDRWIHLYARPSAELLARLSADLEGGPMTAPSRVEVSGVAARAHA